MDLDQQIQDLIDHAPEDGKTPALVRAIAPALKHLSEQLRHTQYYVLQTSDGGWVVTPLTHRSEPSRQKKVIYAYPTVADARAGFSRISTRQNNSDVLAMPVPVSHILFQMLAMKTVDSTVFFETPNDSNTGVEVTQNRLAATIKTAYLDAQTRTHQQSGLA